MKLTSNAKNKRMLPRARRWNFSSLSRLTKSLQNLRLKPKPESLELKKRKEKTRKMERRDKFSPLRCSYVSILKFTTPEGDLFSDERSSQAQRLTCLPQVRKKMLTATGLNVNLRRMAFRLCLQRTWIELKYRPMLLFCSDPGSRMN